jgi:hypothetical protein
MAVSNRKGTTTVAQRNKEEVKREVDRLLQGFAAFVTSEVGEGRDVLTNEGTFWINVLGVWLLFLLVCFNGLTRYALVFDGVGLLIGVLLHTIVIGYLLRRRGRLVSGPSQSSEEVWR